MHMQQDMKWLHRWQMVLHSAGYHSALSAVWARHASYSKESACQSFKTETFD